MLPVPDCNRCDCLYGIDAVRTIEARAIAASDDDGYTLMQRAGAAAFDVLRAQWPRARRIGVLCGSGNNGGDGLILAALAHAAGLDCQVWLLADALPATPLARRALAALRAAGVQPEVFTSVADGFDVLVDALFGIGLNRAPAGDAARAIDAFNEGPALGVVGRLALDVPSGLLAGRGSAPGAVVRADVTVTFIAAKLGLVTGAGRAAAGRVVVADLGIPETMFDAVAGIAERLTYERAAGAFGARDRNAHKGDFGHVLVVGGAPGYAGAGRLAAEAAARCGAGLVSLATHPRHAANVATMRPEIMSHAINEASELRVLAGRASVIAVGPGLGQDGWARMLFGVVCETRQPIVLDADALNLLAREPTMMPSAVITPHPGEAARLLDTTSHAVQADRPGAAAALAARYGAVVVLKGAGTLVCAAGRPLVVIDGGNPGMASGGMGDVLTGVIAALLAQGATLFDAACLGASVHAHAADLAAARDGERGLLAGDLPDWIRRAVNPAL